jgi:hypothetical protein
LLKRGDDTPEELWTGGGEDNVINIEQQIGSLSTLVIDKQRSI